MAASDRRVRARGNPGHRGVVPLSDALDEQENTMNSMRREVLLTLEGPGGSLVVRRIGPVARLMARCRRAKLDRALAAGASPDSSVALELRARALLRRETRLALRSNVETLVTMARRPAPLGSRWRILSAKRVRRVADQLERLLEALSDPRPVDVRGLALTRMLLVDGGSPIYGWADDPVEDLQAAIEEAVDALSIGGSVADRGLWHRRP